VWNGNNPAFADEGRDRRPRKRKIVSAWNTSRLEQGVDIAAKGDALRMRQVEVIERNHDCWHARGAEASG
jgi:hypothetical protein